MTKKSIASIILILAFIILGGVFWYFNIKKGSKKIFNSKENDKNSKLILEDRREEINQDKLVWYEIPELGIKFKISGNIKNELIYSYRGNDDSYGVVLFSSKKLSEIPGCDVDQGPLTSISKIKGIPTNYQDADYIIARKPRQFDGFFILHDGPQSVCASDNYIEEWKKYFEQYPEFEKWSANVLDTVIEIN